ncbi:MAG: MarR family transcriptional regulator [Halobacteriales archaeon]
MTPRPDRTASVLDSKRDATRYRILVEIAKRQPAVSQQEIADEIGVTAQAVSEYLGGLVEDGYVETEGRGRYEVTKEGVDWVISQTDALADLVEHVSKDVLEGVDVEAAIAATAIEEGETVSLTMRDGILTAVPEETGGATAAAVTDAAAGTDVGVTNFEGVLDYDLGTVTVVSIPPVEDGGSRAVDPAALADLAADHDLVAVDRPEGLATVRAAGIDPDLRFGTADAAREAAAKGLDVLLVAASTGLSAHTDTLAAGNVSYEVVDAAER